MKNVLFLFIGIFLSITVFAQSTPPATYRTAYGEFLSVSGISIFTANYDSRFNKKTKGIGFHVGVGFLGSIGTSVIVVPLGVNWLKGKAPNYLEAGLGVTVLTLSGYGAGTAIVPSVGYRHQPSTKGVGFRVFASPWVATQSGGALLMAGGVSVGYVF
ncbi:MAG: hypothetical protein ACOYKE_01660 [Ferruginibacter sp.]